MQLHENQDQFIFISSEKITENVDLLHLLETSYNVLIYERRYIDFRTTDSASKISLQPDVLVDERTCIHLQDLLSLAGAEAKNTLEELRNMVLSFSLKCQKCYLILNCTKDSGYVNISW